VEVRQRKFRGYTGIVIKIDSLDNALKSFL